MKIREKSMREAINLAGLIVELIRLCGFVMLVDLNRKCIILKDKANNEEFTFSVGGEIIEEQ